MVVNTPVGVSDMNPAQFILLPICILGILIPAPIHFKSRNTGVILFIIYVLSMQIPMFVNAIIWRGNVDNPVPYWCDLGSFLIAIAPSGMAAATLCITRQLHRLAKAQAVIISQREVRNFSFYLKLL
jgi:pheromone a factor receptor